MKKLLLLLALFMPASAHAYIGEIRGAASTASTYLVNTASSTLGAPNIDCTKTNPLRCFIDRSTATITTTRASSTLKITFHMIGNGTNTSGCYIDIVVDQNYSALVGCAYNRVASTYTEGCSFLKTVTAGTHTAAGLISTNGGGNTCSVYEGNMGQHMIIEELPQ